MCHDEVWHEFDDVTVYRMTVICSRLVVVPAKRMVMNGHIRRKGA